MCRARLGTSAFLLGAPSLAEILVAWRAQGKPPGGGGGWEGTAWGRELLGQSPGCREAQSVQAGEGRRASD